MQKPEVMQKLRGTVGLGLGVDCVVMNGMSVLSKMTWPTSLCNCELHHQKPMEKQMKPQRRKDFN